MATEQELPLVSADFNEVDDDNVLGVLPRQADQPHALLVGARVRLRDEEGSTMLGDVIERSEGLALIQLLPDTWSAPPAPMTSNINRMAGTSLNADVWVLSKSQVIIVFQVKQYPYYWSPKVRSVSAAATATATPELAAAS